MLDNRMVLNRIASPAEPTAAFDPKLTVGIPGVSVEIPMGPPARWLWQRIRRPRTVSLLPMSGDIFLDSFCDGSAVVHAVVLHPASDVCPVGRIDVEHWLFSQGVSLKIQGFYAHVEGRSATRCTPVRIALALSESQIKIIKATIGDAALKSDVPRMAGIPYEQRLHVRLHFRGRKENSEVQVLTIPNVPIHVTGRIERTVADL